MPILAIDYAEIFESNGRKVIVTTAIDKTINVEQLQNGMYFLKIASNGFVEYFKFINE